VTKEELMELYKNKQFYNTVRKICLNFFNENQAQFERYGAYKLCIRPGAVLKGNEYLEYEGCDGSDDLLQEAWIHLLSLSRNDDKGKPYSWKWYYLCTKNKLIDILRKHGRRCEIVPSEYLDDNILYGIHKEVDGILWEERNLIIKPKDNIDPRPSRGTDI